jgi:hypothetical protein
MAWTGNARIAGQLSKASPALGLYRWRVLHLVHLGDRSNHLWHSYIGASVDDRWRRPDTGGLGNYPIPDQLSRAAPALCFVGHSDQADAELHMVHLGNESNHLWHSIWDDSEVWHQPDGTPGNYQIPDQLSKASPALAEFGDQLHMVHLGDESNHIWHSYYDRAKQEWLRPDSGKPGNYPIPDQLSKAPPALAEFDGQLHMVHLGDESNHIWHSYFDGEKWRRPDTGGLGNYSIPDQLSKAAPALADFGGLHMVHLGDDSNHLWHSVWDAERRIWVRPDNRFPGNYPIPDQLSRATPALSPFALVMAMVHLGDDSNEMWTSYYDPGLSF